MKDTKTPLQSIDRVFSVLELLSGSFKPMSAVEISQKLELKRTTVYGLLDSLLATQYIIKNDNKYEISGKMYSMALRYPYRFPVTSVASKYMFSGSQQFKCISNLGIMGLDNKALLIKTVYPDDSVVGLESGSMFPLYSSAIGKLLLAYQEDEKREELISSIDFVKLSKTTIIGENRLKEELKEIRENGYAVNYGEMFDNTYGLAVPIFGADKTVIAAMSFSKSKDDFMKDFDQILSMAKKYASSCSTELGWTLLG